MTKFKDGPAKGQTLMCRRTPIFLRVTECNGKFDALNDEGDTPRPNEKLFAYIMESHLGTPHCNFGGGRSGYYPMVEYHFTDIQPPDAVMRDEEQWGKWCEAMAPRYKTQIEKLTKGKYYEITKHD